MEHDIFWEELRVIIREEVSRQLGSRTWLPVRKTRLTIREFCLRFQIFKSTLYEWIRMGNILPVKMDRRVYVRKKDVEGLIG